MQKPHEHVIGKQVMPALRILLTLSCMLILTACQKPDTSRHRDGDGVAIDAAAVLPDDRARTENGVGPESAAGPENRAGPVAADAQNILDENDRIIADNKRMIAALREYSRIDSVKLDHLTSTCQSKLGASLMDGGAKKVFDCIRSSW